jgi:hypothetical protein
MAELYYFKDGSGNTIIPVADADFFTDDNMDAAYLDGQFYIEFFADAAAATPATPGAGTIVARGAPLGNVYLRDPLDTTINGIDVIPGNGAYSVPQFNGLMQRGKMTLAGITVATHFRAAMWRK